MKQVSTLNKPFNIAKKLKEIELFSVSCSQISKIMIESKTATKCDKIAKLTQKISEQEGKYEAVREGLKSKDTALEKLNLLKTELKSVQETPEVIELSPSVKKYCQDWLSSRLYEKRKIFTSKYTDKGVKKEADAIVYLEQVCEWGLAMKNDRRKTDGFIQGECDVLLFDRVVDVKNSWDFTTFPIYEDEIPNEDYFYQVQGYMHLYKKSKAEVCYVLMDAPDEIIRREAFLKLGRDYEDEQYLEFEQQYKYSHFPKVMRVKQFEFDFDPILIETIKNRVMECRKYIDFLINKHFKK